MNNYFKDNYYYDGISTEPNSNSLIEFVASRALTNHYKELLLEAKDLLSIPNPESSEWQEQVNDFLHELKQIGLGV